MICFNSVKLDSFLFYFFDIKLSIKLNCMFITSVMFEIKIKIVVDLTFINKLFLKKIVNYLLR